MYCRRPSESFQTILRWKRHSRFTSVLTEGPFLYRAEHGPQAARRTLNSVECLRGDLCVAARSVRTVDTGFASERGTQLSKSERLQKAELPRKKRKQALWENENSSRNVSCFQSQSTVCDPGLKHGNRTYLNQRKSDGEKKSAYVS